MATAKRPKPFSFVIGEKIVLLMPMKIAPKFKGLGIKVPVPRYLKRV
jgi:hypothetical protein